MDPREWEMEQCGEGNLEVISIGGDQAKDRNKRDLMASKGDATVREHRSAFVPKPVLGLGGKKKD